MNSNVSDPSASDEVASDQIFSDRSNSSQDKTAAQAVSGKSSNEVMGEEVLEAAENVSGGIKNDQSQAIAELESKIAELTNDLQRTRADFENFRRQTEAQKELYGKAIEEKTIKKVLPLIDDFDRAVASQPDIMAPLAKSFAKTLNTLGIDKIDTANGAEFDPELHFATSVEGDGDKEIIAETLQSGYYYNGEVIRPAFVKVTKK